MSHPHPMMTKRENENMPDEHGNNNDNNDDNNEEEVFKMIFGEVPPELAKALEPLIRQAMESEGFATTSQGHIQHGHDGCRPPRSLIHKAIMEAEIVMEADDDDEEIAEDHKVFQGLLGMVRQKMARAAKDAMRAFVESDDDVVRLDDLDRSGLVNASVASWSRADKLRLTALELMIESVIFTDGCVHTKPGRAWDLLDMAAHFDVVDMLKGEGLEEE